MQASEVPKMNSKRFVVGDVASRGESSIEFEDLLLQLLCWDIMKAVLCNCFRTLEAFLSFTTCRAGSLH